jgi:glutamate dehydrogenase/leucine dehydrogenase
LYNAEGLDVDRLSALRDLAGNDCVLKEQGGERIPPDDLLLLGVDVLSPCARQYAVTMANVHAIRARMICPGANNPVSRAAESVLAERGIPSIPYFAANCGGVLGNRMEVVGVDDTVIESLLRAKNAHRIRQLIVAWRSTGESMNVIAERYALGRFERTETTARTSPIRSSVGRTAIRVFNTGVFPDSLVRLAARRYLDRSLLTDPPIA